MCLVGLHGHLESYQLAHQSHMYPICVCRINEEEEEDDEEEESDNDDLDCPPNKTSYNTISHNIIQYKYSAYLT